MTTTEILTGIKDWVLSKLSLKQDVINDLAAIRSGSQAGSTAVQPSDLSSYFNNASYDTNTHRINFYHGQNIVAYVDASPFIVDGMVDDVRIENGYLVIDFNTASGKQDISIPLTDIFDPSNYYNKAQTNTLLGNKVDKVQGKGLSTNDYTNAEKEKLSGLQNYDDTQVRQLIGQKQDIIQDLEDIRSGAQAGSTAVQPDTLNSELSNTVAESGVYDVTANNNNAKFADLSALLSSQNLNTLIPTDIRRGGMSIKFVQSSDNKYVQYRLASTNWSTDIHDWTSEDPYFIDKIMQEVNEAIDEHTPIEITGDVTNAPDEEDLTSVNVGGTDVLKFKDKAYNPLTYSGMGRVILRKNMVSGVNTLTQSMINQANTIYVIQYDFTLGEDITVPENCILEFDGGSISGDGTGKNTIIGNNTIISSEPKRIFSNVILTGSFVETKFYLDYFANSTDNSLNYIEAVKSTVNINEYAPIHLANRVYNFSSQIDLNEVFVDKAHITLYGEGKGSIINILYGGSTYGGNIDNVDYLFIRDKAGSGWQNLVTITLSNLHITTPDTDSNRGFFHTPTAWTNDTYIIGVTTYNLACVFNVYKAYWFRMNQCTLYGGHTQLRVYDCNSSSVTNCQFRATSQVDGIAIHCTGGHGFNIMGNDFSQHHIAMKFDGGLSENVTIIGNYIEVGSTTQQNYELILNDANTTQLCHNFVISNNAGLHHTRYYDNSEYKQYYGIVCNGRVANSSFDCAIGEWNAVGFNNVGKLYLDESVDESLIKKYFTAYTTMCYYTLAASKSSDMFWDNRELEKRVTQLLLNQENIVNALKQANISISSKTEFEENGIIVVANAITSQFYFRNNHANVKKIFDLSIASGIDGGALFTNLQKLEYVASFDCSNLPTMRSTFSRTNIVEAPYLNTGHITDFTATFDHCSNLKYIPNYDLSSAVNISTMFRSCISLKSLPVLDLTNVENATDTFSTCEQLEDIGGLQNLSVSFHLRESRFITKESVINIANSIYDWATNPSGKTVPSSTPTITFNSLVYNIIDNDTRALFTNKGWAIAST